MSLMRDSQCNGKTPGTEDFADSLGNLQQSHCPGIVAKHTQHKPSVLLVFHVPWVLCQVCAHKWIWPELCHHAVGRFWQCLSVPVAWHWWELTRLARQNHTPHLLSNLLTRNPITHWTWRLCPTDVGGHPACQLISLSNVDSVRQSPLLFARRFQMRWWRLHQIWAHLSDAGILIWPAKQMCPQWPPWTESFKYLQAVTKAQSTRFHRLALCQRLCCSSLSYGQALKH